MDQVTGILVSLGLDNTVLYQFASFIVTFIFLRWIVFTPYLKAYEERRKRTVGSQDVASGLQEEIDSLEASYSSRAKDVNSEIKLIFDNKKLEAVKHSNKLITEAQQKAAKKLESGKQTLQEAYGSARKEMESMIPEVATNIKQRLLH